MSSKVENELLNSAEKGQISDRVQSVVPVSRQ